MIRGADIRRLCEAGNRDNTPNRVFSELNQGLSSGHISFTDFSVRDLFENLVPDGREILSTWSPRQEGSGINLKEAGIATDNYSNITGQLVFNEILTAFEMPGFLWPRLARTIPTQFESEKIAGIGGIGDMAEGIAPAQPYPLATPLEEWVETPTTTKNGLIVPVTKEDIFHDRTGVLQDRANKVGEFLGVNKEKRVLDTVLGITTSYVRNGAAAIASYGDTPFDNLAASLPLVDWTSLETATLLFDGMTDPNTNEPIIVIPTTLIVPSALKWTAKRIMGATEVRQGAISATVPLTVGSSPHDPLAIESSAYVNNRTASNSTWFVGDPKKAFAYMENWPITTVQAPTNSHDEFHRDIVLQFKASEKGSPAVIEPRFMVKATA